MVAGGWGRCARPPCPGCCCACRALGRPANARPAPPSASWVPPHSEHHGEVREGSGGAEGRQGGGRCGRGRGPGHRTRPLDSQEALGRPGGARPRAWLQRRGSRAALGASQPALHGADRGQQRAGAPQAPAAAPRHVGRQQRARGGGRPATPPTRCLGACATVPALRRRQQSAPGGGGAAAAGWQRGGGSNAGRCAPARSPGSVSSSTSDWSGTAAPPGHGSTARGPRCSTHLLPALLACRPAGLTCACTSRTRVRPPTPCAAWTW